MAKYQHASDFVEGNPPYSGVIRDDGQWVANKSHSKDWDDYLEWAKDNDTAPYLSPRNGGMALKLNDGDDAIGSMLDSLPYDPNQPPPVEANDPPRSQRPDAVRVHGGGTTSGAVRDRDENNTSRTSGTSGTSATSGGTTKP